MRVDPVLCTGSASKYCVGERQAGSWNMYTGIALNHFGYASPHNEVVCERRCHGSLSSCCSYLEENVVFVKHHKRLHLLDHDECKQ